MRPLFKLMTGKKGAQRLSRQPPSSNSAKKACRATGLSDVQRVLSGRPSLRPSKRILRRRHASFLTSRFIDFALEQVDTKIETGLAPSDDICSAACGYEANILCRIEVSASVSFWPCLLLF